VDVREANFLDISPIISLLVGMHKETEIELDRIHPAKLAEAVTRTINNGVVFVAIENKRIIGSIGGFESSDWWSDNRYLGDLWFYVHPKERKSKAAVKLLKRFLNFAKSNKLKAKVGHIYSGDLERKDKFYESLGLVKAGTVYVTEKS
jgi:GNAT superfamily N-acetyltransferase|tara:strand:- start:86 stop:529 length:444 start_codon:yes stop_codon:yes gene_type:complete